MGSQRCLKITNYEKNHSSKNKPELINAVLLNYIAFICKSFSLTVFGNIPLVLVAIILKNLTPK